MVKAISDGVQLPRPLHRFLSRILSSSGDIGFAEYFSEEDGHQLGLLKRAINKACRSPEGCDVICYRGRSGGGVNVGPTKSEESRRQFCGAIVQEMLSFKQHGAFETPMRIPSRRRDVLRWLEAAIEKHGTQLARDVVELASRHVSDGVVLENRLRPLVAKIDEELTECSRKALRAGSSVESAFAVDDEGSIIVIETEPPSRTLQSLLSQLLVSRSKRRASGGNARRALEANKDLTEHAKLLAGLLLRARTRGQTLTTALIQAAVGKILSPSRTSSARLDDHYDFLVAKGTRSESHLSYRGALTF
eukprot:scaffold2234_cov211-Pinguiococcus_pyrenoidosus.AAC.4